MNDKNESGLSDMAGANAHGIGPDEATGDNPNYVASTGDDRVVNNVMRHAYKVLNDDEKAAMQKIKDDALAFHEFLNSLGESRELSIAKTKIEESVFWAVKHVTG